MFSSQRRKASGTSSRSLRSLLLTFGAVALTTGTPSANAAVTAEPISLTVDATEISRKFLVISETLPLQTSNASGTIDLVFPKWIPGEHGPTGPIVNLAGLRFATNGHALAWTRDPLDMYRFHVQIPAGAATLDAEFNMVGTYAPGEDFSLGNTATATQGDINWNQVVLYPADTASDDVRVQSSVVLPSGWAYASALPAPREDDKAVRFAPVSLTTLVDSPLMCGQYMRTFDITPVGVAQHHSINIFAQSPDGLAIPGQRIDAFRNLISETGALFGARHYNSYTFLVEEHADSNDGLEHHESSDNQVPRLGMISASFSAEGGSLLTHEMLHSWNGKYRRPAGLATRNYQDPMAGDLLWVYEGLTSYWAEVLATRAGLETMQQVQDRLALYQAEMDARKGRAWRPLQDTATAAQMLYPAPPQWTNLRRSTDFYVEGPLFWLQVDVLLRQKSNGSASLDTFAHNFFGPPSGPPTVRPYRFEDVVAALNQIAPADWAALLRHNLDSLRPTPLAPGLEASGWHVVYNDSPNEAVADAEENNDTVDLSDSLGLVFSRTGDISDVVLNSPAWKVGISSAEEIVAVNQQVFTLDLLRQAMQDAEHSDKPIHLLTLGSGRYRDYSVTYHGGLHYPHLERIPKTEDLLTRILQPRRVTPIAR